METPIDTYVPLVQFEHVEGYDGLARYFSSLGVEVSAAALEIRHRRYGLPLRGGRTRGRPVYFTSPELDAWMQHLRGCTVATWIQRQEARRAADLGIDVRPPGRRGRGGLGKLPPFDLFALTELVPPYTERLARDPSGFLYAARDPAVFADHAAAFPQGIQLRAWRYHGLRRATATDLEPAASKRAACTRRRAGRLLAGLAPVGSSLRWCHVPGRLLDLPHVPAAPLICPWGQSGLDRILRAFREAHPDGLLVIWTRREEIEPFTLEEVPRPERRLEF